MNDTMSWALSPKGMTTKEKIQYCNAMLDILGTLKCHSEDPTEDIFLDGLCIEVRRLREAYSRPIGG